MNEKRFISPLYDIMLTVGFTDRTIKKQLIFILLLSLSVVAVVILFFKGVSLYISVPLAIIGNILLGLKILGNEIYLMESMQLSDATDAQLKAELSTIRPIHNDTIERENGEVSKLLHLYTNTLDDDVFNVLFEEILNMLDKYDTAIRAYNISDKVDLLQNLPKLKVYSGDKAMMKERMDFLQDQARIAKEQSMLYLISIEVITTPTFYDRLNSQLNDIIRLVNENPLLHVDSKIASKEDIEMEINLDLRADLSLTDILEEKYMQELDDIEVMDKKIEPVSNVKTFDVGNRQVLRMEARKDEE